MKWLPFTYQSRDYDLSHLDSFHWYYTAKARGKRPEHTYRFQVKFSMHCFTRDPLEGEKVSEELWYQGPDEKRMFCFDRYQLSRQLPEIIRSLGERNCYRTPHNNFFTIELTDREGNRVEYEIYFDVTRTSRKGWLNLVVQSAYVRTENYASTQPEKLKIGLDVIAHTRLTRKEIRHRR
uniref:Uncharacterized protein n=1 Tax=Candidatus Kentrum sp. DK TaxID=2126562 RepID=A0A450TNV6_9GAMM|nr:MAG: hypothetical protein BECKDK2373B_GA0170837_12463 [Candidatus Kentron sp. DK]